MCLFKVAPYLTILSYEFFYLASFPLLLYCSGDFWEGKEEGKEK